MDLAGGRPPAGHLLLQPQYARMEDVGHEAEDQSSR
jgi:hypothetical protein